jgi:hypothetical protein
MEDEVSTFSPRLPLHGIWLTLLKKSGSVTYAFQLFITIIFIHHIATSLMSFRAQIMNVWEVKLEWHVNNNPGI